MQKIRILPENLANKIAAGEVIQRPASVIKELIENSIDSGADEIIIYIKNGGRDLIQIVDNGEGMSEDDLLLAFEPHATSKIFELHDLEKIQTLGFRGEALPSIGSVSMVEARSCQDDSQEGRQLIIRGGAIKTLEPMPMKRGSSIFVRKLFFNTPARRKFLKSANTEYRHVIEVIRKFALGYPEVKFQFYSNDSEIFNLKKNDLKNRIGELFTKNHVKKLIPIGNSKDGILLNGFVGNLDLVRKKSVEQYLFVNDRLIVDRMMNSAVYSAYGSLIKRGEFPFFVLKLKLNPEEIDVNVHPSKTEIKFQNGWQIYQFIKNSVMSKLGKVKDMIPQMSKFPQNDFIGDSYQNRNKQLNKFDKYTFGTKNIQGNKPLSDNELQSQLSLQMTHKKQNIIDESFDRKESNIEKEFSFDDRINRFKSSLDDLNNITKDVPYSNLWQVHNKYIMAQISSGVIVIDQHVAHERILFEQALKFFNDSLHRSSQQLLFPVSLELKPDDFSILLDILPSLQKLGFSMRKFGKNTIILEAIPSNVQKLSEEKIILEILDDYKKNHNVNNPITYKVAASYACKAAIKAGEKLEIDEMQRLIDELFQTENPYFCPHGRPVIVNLSLDELDKRFERK
ncbi:MAG: DNA mismatch repair endonuclease MutL [Candidatus Marinimicrobia bacterium]|nr:DNA mismatch repair endonuclease MutL [Candidatus Neomarinimicrobiota bacterium]